MFLQCLLFVLIFAGHVILQHLVRPNFLLTVVLSPFSTGHNTGLAVMNLFVEIESDTDGTLESNLAVEPGTVQ